MISNVGIYRADKQEPERESRPFIVDLWRVAFDGTRIFESLNTITDCRCRYLNFVCDFLDRDITCIVLEYKENASVDIIERNFGVGLDHLIGLIVR